MRDVLALFIPTLISAWQFLGAVSWSSFARFDLGGYPECNLDLVLKQMYSPVERLFIP
ncbi:hypothetical protein [[Phormidium] sp. ETS-05]|uniref:hypothetical protein n=1 Tax=[Phormidium] sp. ETS-05 TaxID=222819 RepID=UPI0018EF31B7|nr:hypothetical protein [[Phormidium] sp. ETS-05]